MLECFAASGKKEFYADEADESRRVPGCWNWKPGTNGFVGSLVSGDYGAETALSHVDVVEMPNERRQFYRGQAYFFKVLAYFDLIRRWGDCILQKGELTGNL